MDNSDHMHRVQQLAKAVASRPPGTLVRAERGKSHTPYANLGGYGTSDSPQYFHADVTNLNHILEVVDVMMLVTTTHDEKKEDHHNKNKYPATATMTVEAGVTMRDIIDSLLGIHSSSSSSLPPQGHEEGLLYLPALPVEGESFSVGGLVTGFGIQSRSHSVGLFQDTVTEIEIITGTGEIVRASEKQHQQLFHLLPGSFGTLGIVTAVTFRLSAFRLPFLSSPSPPPPSPSPLPSLLSTITPPPHNSSPLIRCVCTQFSNADTYAAGMLAALKGNSPWCHFKNSSTPPPKQQQRAAPAVFIEGYVFSSKSFVVVECEFVLNEVNNANSTNISNNNTNLHFYNPRVPGSPYFYQQVEQIVSSSSRLPTTKNTSTSSTSSSTSSTSFSSFSFPFFTMNLRDYLFRHTRGLWWGLDSYLGIPFLTRTTTGRAILDGESIKAEEAKKQKKQQQSTTTTAAAAERGWQPSKGSTFTHQDYTRCLPTQGFYIRASRLASMIRASEKELGIYPMWTCPVRVLPASEGEGGMAEGRRRGGKRNNNSSVASSSSSSSLHESLNDPTTNATTTRGRLWFGLVGDRGELGTNEDEEEQAEATDEKIEGSSFKWAFDVGVYGCPTSMTYRAFSSVRRLQQQYADSPTQWGLTYMTREEMEQGGYSTATTNTSTTTTKQMSIQRQVEEISSSSSSPLHAKLILDIPSYLRVRKEYHAEKAFPLLWEKIRPYNPMEDLDALGVPCCWRWRRDNIYFTCVTFWIALLAIVLGFLCAAVGSRGVKWLM